MGQSNFELAYNIINNKMENDNNSVVYHPAHANINPENVNLNPGNVNLIADNIYINPENINMNPDNLNMNSDNSNMTPVNMNLKTETEPDVEKIYCQYCELEFTDFDLWRAHEEEESRMYEASEAMSNANNSVNYGNQQIPETFQEGPNFQQNQPQPESYPQSI